MVWFRQFESVIELEYVGNENIFKDGIRVNTDTHIHRVIRRHERAEHRLEVRASCSQDGFVRWYHVLVEYQFDVTEFTAAGFQKNRQVILQGGA